MADFENIQYLHNIWHKGRSLIMGGGGVGEKRGAGGGFNYFCLNCGRPETEKYVKGRPQFYILSYSFSKYLNLLIACHIK
jgi:hypothetical protein